MDWREIFPRFSTPRRTSGYKHGLVQDLKEMVGQNLTKKEKRLYGSIDTEDF